MLNRESSYVAINRFKKLFNLSDGDVFWGSVDVETDTGENILADSCECVFSYNVGYQQSEIIILWTYSDKQLNSRKIKKGFNTNQNNFILNDNCLNISDKNMVITINYIGKE